MTIMQTPPKRIIYLKGMHGMGDNFHQRHFIKQYMQEYDYVYLESSWCSIYWDLILRGLRVVHKDSYLRTQDKNAKREASMFWRGVVPHVSTPGTVRTDKQIWYRAKDIRHTGSVLGAMAECLNASMGDADFRFPIKDEWQKQYFNEYLPKFNTGGKPILVYRPLVERKEWSGCSARNPDQLAHEMLYRSIRDKFYVISIADLEKGKEWIVDKHGIKADIEFHNGQVPVEMVATIVHNAAMTFCSPGFAVIMSQAVETPVACVFGGYENSASFSIGEKWAPYLGIDPINSCQCFMHVHQCDKRIDIPKALEDLRRFTDAAILDWKFRDKYVPRRARQTASGVAGVVGA